MERCYTSRLTPPGGEAPPGARRGRGRRRLLALAWPALAALSGLATTATIDAALIDLREAAEVPDGNRGGLRRTTRQRPGQPAGMTTEGAGRRRRGLQAADSFATPPNTGNCDPVRQHALQFTFYTDSKSMDDNDWSITSSAYGTKIDGGAVSTGNFGYGAVIERRVCADKIYLAGTYASYFEELGGKEDNPNVVNSAVESCYDTVMDDSAGDGLTKPWGAGRGGKFTLLMNGVEVATHSSGKFERCAFRACATGDGGHHTLSNLAGSDCKVAEPKCDEAYHKERIVKVELRTDSYASDETSWELRRSDVNASPMLESATNSELLMAGGSPVFDDAGRAWMGQFGVGVDLDGPDEKFESTTCMSEEEAASRNGGCYDFRAYDTYGDGLGCGADGLIKVQVGQTKLVQRDGNMARKQKVDAVGGEKINACMDPNGLVKWAYCAVRICADGTVSGLQGNQCKFGMGSELIDWKNMGKDPLVDEMDGIGIGEPPETMDEEVIEEEEEEEGPYRPLPTALPPDEEEFIVPITHVDPLPTAIPWENELIEEMIEEIEQDEDHHHHHDHEHSKDDDELTVLIVPQNELVDDHDHHDHQDDHDHDVFYPDETWAEYYDRLDPGFHDEDGMPMYASIPGPVSKGTTSRPAKFKPIAFKAVGNKPKPVKGAKRQQKQKTPSNRPGKKAKGALKGSKRASNGLGGIRTGKRRDPAPSGSDLNAFGYVSGTQVDPSAARGVLKGGNIQVTRAGARPRRRKGSGK